jgi:hypothetical protein
MTSVRTEIFFKLQEIVVSVKKCSTRRDSGVKNQPRDSLHYFLFFEAPGDINEKKYTSVGREIIVQTSAD